ncbi:ATP-dependent RNA helicase glh-1-like [Drosophila serrata]|uniref:ATP-dependent RNA helicase glh-1-like n=1 Tax=Drosophila serrata TaxID=7274 RepID=UPI000A1D39E1|nr:ATP-dependent RNA helicase glh-1-like [Drosophila serrata]
MSSGGETANIICFNCRLMGHFSSQCQKPKRPDGACFDCFETGHQYRQCPNRRRTAALSTSDGKDEKDGDDDSIGGNSFIQLIPEAH